MSPLGWGCAILLLVSGCVAGLSSPGQSPAREKSPGCEGVAESLSKRGPAPRDVLSGDSEAIQAKVPSFDGHQIPATIHKPRDASGEHPVPILLQGHGWSGGRVQSSGAFKAFHRGGFGVVSIDMRGHGEARSTSEARVLHVDHEIKDVVAVIDYMATLDWVLHDGPTDPRIGALGGSYGGGYQLLAAAYDSRLDAIAPDITWNDLVQSLAPNGAVKSAWIDILYGSGNGLARVHPDIHQAFLVAQSQNRIADGSLPGEPNLKAQFLRSSAASYAAEIDIPTLITQGANDTLFDLNEGLRNFAMISSACRETRLITHLSGHILNTRGTIGESSTPAGLQGPDGGSPCGSLNAYRIAFYQVQLLGLTTPMGPRVCLAMDDGSHIEAKRFPLPGTETFSIPLGTLQVPQGAPASVRADALRGDAGLRLVGAPILRGNASVPTGAGIIYFTFEATGADGTKRGFNGEVNAQVTPLRLDSAGPKPFQLEMGALSAVLEAGDRLELVASSQHPQYAHNGNRVPGLVTLTGLALEIPAVHVSG